MKKILAFTLALAMVLSSTTMTFAASKEVEALANLKLLLNTTDAEVNADLNRAVGLAMVLKALGYTQEDANAKAEANTFVDMEKYGWAKGFTVLGEELKITNGTSVEPKMFSPNANLNERAFVAFMLRALGYDVDAAWAKAGELAKEAGVAETVTENKLTKGDAAVIMYKALMAKVQGDEKGRTLAQKLVDEKKLDKDLAVANGLISGEPEKLTVTAMADNLIEVTVSFDGTVDKETAEKTGNYKVKGATVQNATVKEDGKTVVLVLKDALANKREFELTVAGVKNVAGVVMDKQTVKFSTNDVTAPTVEKITVTGPKNFEITFSEPMKTAGTIAVKFGKSSLQVKNKALKGDNRVVSVELYNSFQEGKEYTVMVGDGKKNTDYPQDYANYTAAYYEEVLTYAKDTTAPEVKVVKADQEKVTLEFTKPVKGLDKKFFSHTFSSYHPLRLVDEKGNALSGAVTKAVLVFYDQKDKDNSRALPAGEVKVMVLGKSGNDKIQDNWGNQLADTELVVSISADREAPQVTAVEVKGKNAVEVTFSEEIKVGTDVKKEVTVQLLDKDGKVVEKNDTTKMDLSNGNKVLTLTFKNNYVGKTMTLVLKNVKDNSLYSNVMADYSTELEFNDKELKFKDEKAEFQVKDGSYYVYVTYAEEMGDSALELANYRFRKDNASDVQPKGSAEFLDGNRKIVAIELTVSDKDEDNTDVKFLTGVKAGTEPVATAKVVLSDRIKDLAGNADARFEFPVAINKLSSNPFTIAKITAVANNKIQVEFNRDVVDVDSDVVYTTAGNQEHPMWVFAAGGDHKVVSVERVSGNDKTVELTLEEGKELPGNVDNDLNMTLKINEDNNKFTDIFGQKAKNPASPNEALSVVQDKIRPAVASIKQKTDGATTEASIYSTGFAKADEYKGKPRILVSLLEAGKAKVRLHLTEGIKTESLSSTTFVVNNGWKVDTAALENSNAEVVLEISKADGTIAELQDLTVTQKAVVRDERGNETDSSNINKEMDTLYAVPAVTYNVKTAFAENGNKVDGELEVTIEAGKFAAAIADFGTGFELVGDHTWLGTANDKLKVTRVSDTKITVAFKDNQLPNEHDAGTKTVTLKLKKAAFDAATGKLFDAEAISNLQGSFTVTLK